MKYKVIESKLWFYIAVLPAITIAASLLLWLIDMPASQYVHAVVWGVGLVLVAVAVNIDNRSALALLVLGLVLPVLTLVSYFAQVMLAPVTVLLAVSWVLLGHWQIQRFKLEENNNRLGRINPEPGASSLPTHTTSEIPVLNV